MVICIRWHFLSAAEWDTNSDGCAPCHRMTYFTMVMKTPVRVTGAQIPCRLAMPNVANRRVERWRQALADLSPVVPIVTLASSLRNLLVIAPMLSIRLISTHAGSWGQPDTFHSSEHLLSINLHRHILIPNSCWPILPLTITLSSSSLVDQMT